MRISDWSSDVCSSDLSFSFSVSILMLSTRIIDPALSAVRRSASARRISRQMGMRILLDLKQPRVPRHGRCPVMGDLAGVGVTQVDQKVALDEIGRGWGRERVW